MSSVAAKVEAVPRAAVHPRGGLGVFDVAAIVVGVVVGAGIFRMPGLVAANAGSSWEMMGLWAAGGLLSFVGALCYAELATAYPHSGGEYHFLSRSFGNSVSFLFCWTRMTVIQTGSIALQAYIVGDYLSQVAPLGGNSSAIYAAVTVIALTAINSIGFQLGRAAQNVLTVATLGALLFVAIAGFASPAAVASAAPAAPDGGRSLGLAMVFVLLTYGGWNEAAYLSAEVRDGKWAIAKALFYGLGAVTALYLLMNFALVRGLGLAGLASSEAPAADLLRNSPFGAGAAAAISLIIAVAALSTTNATIITGARTNFALGQDYKAFSLLGRWREKGSTPANALFIQGAIALALVMLATSIQQSGVEAMVAFTAPAFWLFFMLVGFSVFVLRRWDSGATRSFRVPLYPLTPLIFCALCAYMLHSSLNYASSLGAGGPAWIALGIVAVGVLFLLLARPNGDSEQHLSKGEKNP